MGGWRLGKGRGYRKAEDWKSKPMTAKSVKPKVRIHTFLSVYVYSHTCPQSDRQVSVATLYSSWSGRGVMLRKFWFRVEGTVNPKETGGDILWSCMVFSSLT